MTNLMPVSQDTGLMPRTVQRAITAYNEELVTRVKSQALSNLTTSALVDHDRVLSTALMLAGDDLYKRQELLTLAEANAAAQVLILGDLIQRYGGEH